MPPRSFRLVVDTLGRPPLANGRQHWAAKARETALWRKTGGLTARAAKIPKLGPVEIRVYGRYPGGKLPDPEGLAPAFKAVLDGLVDVGVIPNDTGEYVRSVIFLPPSVEKGKFPGLVVEITEAKV